MNPFQYQPQFSPMLQAMQPSGIAGRTVATHDEIRPNEVPMNGAAAYFPTQDGMAVYAKQWNQDGSITTVRYVPETGVEDAPKAPTLADISAQLSNIEAMLKPKPRRSTAKKEAEDE